MKINTCARAVHMAAPCFLITLFTRCFLKLVTIVGALVVCSSAMALPGDLDLSFGKDGKVVTNLSTVPGISQIVATVLQPDGKLVAAGLCAVEGVYQFCVARYGPTGAVDTAFGSGGVVRTPIGQGNGFAYSVALDGTKLITAGACNLPADGDYCFARYNADGSLDSSFASSGTLRLSPGIGSGTARSVIVSNGKYVAGGTCGNGTNVDFCVVRIHSDGTLDTSFGTNGVTQVPVGSGNDVAQAMAISAGKIILAGYCENGARFEFCAIRLNENGHLDTTFNTTGKINIAIGAVNDYATEILADGDKILLGGSCYMSADFSHFCLLRLNADGSADTTAFSGSASTITTMGASNSQMTGLALDGGKIVAGGRCLGNFYVFCIARYNADGTLDATFGTAGKVYSATAGVSEAILLDGLRPVVAGTCDSPNSFSPAFCVMRFLGSGAPDPAFGDSGLVTSGWGTAAGNDVASALARQADGKLVAAGKCAGASIYEFCVSRYLRNGTLDLSFGGTGRIVTPLGSPTHTLDGRLRVLQGGVNSVSAIAIDGDNIVVAGMCDYDYCIVRYRSDGTLDTSFGGTGKVIVQVGVQWLFYPQLFSVVVNDGKTMIVGDCSIGPVADGFPACLYRFNGNGTRDALFGVNGGVRVSTNIFGARGGAGGPPPYIGVNVVKNKILLAGVCLRNSGDFCIARLNMDGTLDSTLRGTGMANAGLTSLQNARSVLVDGQKIVIAGICTNGARTSLCVARLLSDGTPDTSFNGSGLVVTAVGPGNDAAASVQKLGTKLVVSGTCNNGNDEDYCALVYRNDGSLDTSFNGTGKKLFALTSGADVASASVVDGAFITMLGTCPTNRQTDFCLIRFAAPFLAPAPGDLSADGRSDVLFRGDGGAIEAILMNGVSPGAAATIVAADYDWAVTHVADINGDGKADLILRNADGRVAVLIMDGSNVVSFTELVPAGSGWAVTHTADFNGDGKADLLLKNVDGRVAVLLLNGPAVISYTELFAPGSLAVPTHVGDFNGDGMTDIILRHTNDSSVVLLMNGAAVSSASFLLNPGSPWAVTHVADLNGDGKADVIIRRLSDNTAAILLMNGTTVTSAAFLLTPDSPYTVTHIGDFNGDGKADILVRSNDGSVVMLQMDGNIVNAATYLLLAGTTHTVVQIADYNGDGKSDILLRESDGVGTVVLMDGGVVTAAATLSGTGRLQVVP